MTKPTLLVQCERSADCDRPGIVDVKHLPTGDWLKTCRPHRREIQRENADHIGHCEYDLKDQPVPCDHFPYTMREVNGSEIAVCRRHESIVNQMYAEARTNKQHFPQAI